MARHVHRFCERATFFRTNETNDSSEIKNDGQIWVVQRKDYFFFKRTKKNI